MYVTLNNNNRYDIYITRCSNEMSTRRRKEMYDGGTRGKTRKNAMRRWVTKQCDGCGQAYKTRVQAAIVTSLQVPEGVKC